MWDLLAFKTHFLTDQALQNSVGITRGHAPVIYTPHEEEQVLSLWKLTEKYKFKKLNHSSVQEKLAMATWNLTEFGDVWDSLKRMAAGKVETVWIKLLEENLDVISEA